MANEQYPPRTYAKMYHPPEENSGDNPRVRRRMSVAFKVAAENDHIRISNQIEAELGIDRPESFSGYVDWPQYLERLNRRDFLSAFSVLARFLKQESTGQYSFIYSNRLKTLFGTLERIFAEENVLLEFGSDGIIHPRIDAAFERERVFLIRGLADGEYEAARNHITKVENALMSDPPDGAEAIWRVFCAAENIFKQMSKTQNLNTRDAKSELTQIVEQLYPSGSNKLHVARKQIEGFCRWIEGAHFYRHEEGKQEPSQPSEEMYVLAVSEGFAFVRWLVELKNLSRP